MNKEIDVGERAEMKQATSVKRSPFIGRQREIADLQDALDQARAGQPRVVMLEGEPGIGKTRTAQEVSEDAARHATLVRFESAPRFSGSKAAERGHRDDLTCADWHLDEGLGHEFTMRLHEWLCKCVSPETASVTTNYSGRNPRCRGYGDSITQK